MTTESTSSNHAARRPLRIPHWSSAAGMKTESGPGATNITAVTIVYPVMLRTCCPNDRAGIATGSSCCRDVSIIYVCGSVSRERKHGRDAGALDRVLELALMQRARSGDTARKDLPPL